MLAYTRSSRNTNVVPPPVSAAGSARNRGRLGGSFTRAFSLPSTVNVDAVNAEFKDGVLRVTLPKKEEVKARQIQVTVTDAKGAKA